MSRRRRMVLALLGLSTACTSPDAPGDNDGFVPAIEIGDPLVEIGALEGADEYVFGAISNAVRLDDGSIVVADGLAQRISIYDADGTFLRAWGREGGGPGEFENLAGVIRFGPDSLIAAESFRDQLTVFDLEGNPGRTLSAVELSSDSTFSLDSWLHGRYWIEGGIRPVERERVRRTLAGYVPPDGEPGMRNAVVGDDGSVWIAEPRLSVMATQTWTRLSPDGTPSASLEIPRQLRPTHFESDRVTGVWRDENDVSYVRSYGWAESGIEWGLPGWMLPAEPASARQPSSDDVEAAVLDDMRNSILSLARAQEIHYSTAMSYTSDISVLDEIELPEGLHVSFTKGDSRGWTAVFAHDDLDRICGLGYGFDLPRGWVPGRMQCAPPMGAPAP